VVLGIIEFKRFILESGSDRHHRRCSV
jgi:hypothetical protein